MEQVIIFLSTYIASIGVFLALIGLIALDCYRRGLRREAFLIAGTTALVVVTVTALKAYFGVPRPSGGLVTLDGYGFPSGHATAVVYFAGVLWYYLVEVLGVRSFPVVVLLCALIVLVGVSRLYLGVHTPLQIVAGYTSGSALAILFLAIVSRRR